MHGFGLTDCTSLPITMLEGYDAQPIASDKDPVVLHVQYQSVLPHTSNYMLPFVKVEISCLSMDEPTELISLESMIHEVYPNYDTDAIIQARTVRPTRTFLEKAFLLCEEFQKENPRTLRMTRHLYDLYRLAQTPFAKEAMEDVELYHKIVQHREAYYHIKYVDYSMLLPNAISFVPPENLIGDYKVDYQMMLQEYIYDEQAPSFEELLDFMSQLQQQFRNIH